MQVREKEIHLRVETIVDKTDNYQAKLKYINKKPIIHTKSSKKSKYVIGSSPYRPI